MDDCIGFRGSKTLKKNYCEISPQKIHFMRNKQSGNLNREKSRILPGGKLSYSFFSGQNLLENVIKHCLSVFSRFSPMKCSRLTLLILCPESHKNEKKTAVPFNGLNFFTVLFSFVQQTCSNLTLISA